MATRSASTLQRSGWGAHWDAWRRSSSNSRAMRSGFALPSPREQGHALRKLVSQQAQRLERARLRLDLLDPRLVLERGYALLTREDGSVLFRAAQARPGDAVKAHLADGQLDLTVMPSRLI